MKRLHKTMLVLCVIGLLVLSSGVALGIKGVDKNATKNLSKNVTDINATNKTNVTTTVTPIGTYQPVYTTTKPVETTVRPIVTDTETVPIVPKETLKSPGFGIILTMGTLYVIYIFRKRR